MLSRDINNCNAYINDLLELSQSPKEKNNVRRKHMNNITLMGRLVRDVELRYTPNNTAVASFTLAVDRGYTPKDGGERQTDFIDCIAWRNTAEFLEKYFVKGQMMALTGSLQIRSWEDKNGNKRRTAEVIVNSVFFTESKKSRDTATTPSASPDISTDDFYDVELNDGELPF